MKKLLFVILLVSCFSVDAIEHEEDIAVIQMANEIFERATKDTNFDWTDYSCESLMEEAYELASHAIENNLTIDELDPIGLREEWMP